MQSSYKIILLYSFALSLLLPTVIFSQKKDTLNTNPKKSNYQIFPVNGLNTSNSEFCITKYEKGIVYVTNQPKDLVNNEINDINGYPYVDVYYTEFVDGLPKKPEPFSGNVNGPYHDGPVSFTSDFSKLYLTRVVYIKKNRHFVNKAKIIVFTKTGEKWKEETNFFPHNSDDYSCGHASLSKNGELLFFTSDMPGGQGGKDIYVCKKNGNTWGSPENLGPNINTPGDEEFPFIRQDGILFFSSNGLKGLGGFDIFSAYSTGQKWYLLKNEGSPLNSNADDFGITFTDRLQGYFTSNRAGGKGLDDLYSFKTLETGINIYASLLLTENIDNPSKNTLVHLLSENGNSLDTTRTNNKGAFKFENIEPNKKYLVTVDEDDINFKGKAKFFLANANGEIVRSSHPYQKNNFAFDNLPIDSFNIQDSYIDGDLTLAGTLSHGSNPSTFMKGAELYLQNSFGDIIDTASTNDLGVFVFKNLIKGQSYIININEKKLNLPLGTLVKLSDKNGNKLKTFITGKDAFSFKLLSHEKSFLSELETDEELNFSLNNCTYGQDKLILKSLANKKVYLLNKSGHVIDSVITNNKSKFKFNNLSVAKEYIVALDEDDLSMKNKKEYYLVNANGNIVKVSYPFKNRKFVFTNIPIDTFSLQEITADDKLFLAGNLRFGSSGQNPLTNTRVYLLNEKGIVIDSATSNEYGCFSFRGVEKGHNYTMTIVEADTKLASGTKVILTDKNGKVLQVYYVGKDAFEYKILSVEKNMLNDLETNDDDLVMKLNGYVYTINKTPVKNVEMALLDSAGHILYTTTTDSFGRFSFPNTKPHEVGRVEIVGSSILDSVLLIADHNQKIRRVVRKNNSGNFVYKLLEVDKKMLGEYTIDDPWLKVMEMKKTDKELTIVESIFYKTNDYKFDFMGEQILDKTIAVLKSNPKLIMELSSHTDSRSNDSYNLKLSQRRAKYAVDYIVAKGINSSRLKAVGYGETRLINKCKNDIECTEDEHAKNRRTEFKLSLEK